MQHQDEGDRGLTVAAAHLKLLAIEAVTFLVTIVLQHSSSSQQ